MAKSSLQVVETEAESITSPRPQRGVGVNSEIRMQDLISNQTCPIPAGNIAIQNWTVGPNQLKQYFTVVCLKVRTIYLHVYAQYEGIIH